MMGEHSFFCLMIIKCNMDWEDKISNVTKFAVAQEKKIQVKKTEAKGA